MYTADRLQVQPLSGLSFPWAEFVSKSGSTSEASLGQESGAGVGMVILVRWADIQTALQELVGYSFRVPTTPNPRLSRVLPWKHPLWPQLFCTQIPRAVGVKWVGKEEFITGPVSAYELAMLTLRFSRPPYPILSDEEVSDGAGGYEEWNRYTDRFWVPSTEMLTREGMTFTYTEGTAPLAADAKFPGSPGIPLSKVALTRTWYQIPQDAIYDADGFPTNLFIDSVTGDSRLACVNGVEFFGCPAGTLLYNNVEIIPRPLPLPPALMGIVGESAQLQYDVKFHFIYFNPTIGPGATTRGHNTMPWPGDGFWYLVESESGDYVFQYIDIADLFQIL